MTDTKTDSDLLNTLSERAILLQILKRLDHHDVMLHELHSSAQELLPHARAAVAAKAKVSRMLGGKRGAVQRTGTGAAGPGGQSAP